MTEIKYDNILTKIISQGGWATLTQPATTQDCGILCLMFEKKKNNHWSPCIYTPGNNKQRLEGLKIQNKIRGKRWYGPTWKNKCFERRLGQNRNLKTLNKRQLNKRQIKFSPFTSELKDIGKSILAKHKEGPVES